MRYCYFKANIVKIIPSSKRGHMDCILAILEYVWTFMGSLYELQDGIWKLYVGSGISVNSFCLMVTFVQETYFKHSSVTLVTYFVT